MSIPLRDQRRFSNGDPAFLVDADIPAAGDLPAQEVDAAAHEESGRRRSVRRSALPALLCADAIALSVAVVSGQLIDYAINARGTVPQAFESVLYVPVFLVVMACYDLYRRGRRRLIGSSFPDFSQMVHSIIVGSVVAMLLSGGLHEWLNLPNIDRTGIFFTGAIALLAVTQGRALARWRGRRPKAGLSKVLIVGSGIVASSVVARLRNVSGIQVVGCVDDNIRNGDEPWESLPLLGGLDAIPEIVAAHDVDHVIVAFSPATGATLAGLLRSLANDVQISVVPRLFDLLTVRSHIDDLYGLPVVDVAPASLGPADRFAKRAMDMVASGLGLLLLSPVMITIAIAIKLTSPGPILFKQKRTGRGGGSFNIYKFRTMRDKADQFKHVLVNEVDGPLFKVREDPRITRVGRFLRHTSLDELPQLINVFRGDMSLVGPRPFITSESAEIAGWASRRFDVRPGMTGLWQVSGRNDLPFDELCRLDYSYVASWSLWWDVRILWHTPGIVFRHQGAY